MEYKALRRFLAVMDYGGFTAAAKGLGLTQQALSASIAKLESDLNVVLFTRSRGGATRPTAFGRLLVRHARAQILGADRALSDIQNLKEAQAGTVTVGVGEAFAAELAAEAFRRFLSLRPDVRVNVVDGYSMHLIERLLEGEFDFIAAGNSDLDTADGLAKEVVYTVDDVVAGRAAHPLAGAKDVQLQDMARYPWIVPYARTTDFEVIRNTFRAHDVEPPAQIIRSDSIAVGLHLIANEDYLIMTTPALIGHQFQRRFAMLHRIDTDKPTVTRNACLVFVEDRPMSAPARIMLEQLRQVCDEETAAAAAPAPSVA
ncbi:MAG: LysR family transcriptional regulator [Caulobacterales bacterium]|nr:LysR family transcriptional regulator [Caulobacterales bacterium]